MRSALIAFVAGLLALAATPSLAQVPKPKASVAPATVERGVREVLAQQLGRRPEAIAMDTPLVHPTVGADELDIVEIVMALEDRFKIAIDDAKVEPGLTPRHLVNIVEQILRMQRRK